MLEKKTLEGPNPREAFDGLTNIAIFGGSIFYALAVAAIEVGDEVVDERRDVLAPLA